MVRVSIGYLPKNRAEEYITHVKENLNNNSEFSNKELYTIYVYPVSGDYATSFELYSVPK